MASSSPVDLLAFREECRRELREEQRSAEEEARLREERAHRAAVDAFHARLRGVAGRLGLPEGEEPQDLRFAAGRLVIGSPAVRRAKGSPPRSEIILPARVRISEVDVVGGHVYLNNDAGQAFDLFGATAFTRSVDGLVDAHGTLVAVPAPRKGKPRFCELRFVPALD